jgi:quercetin dioxygenase-like cupin family protein
MQVKRIEDMVGGWFVGNFDPSVLRTHDFEVGYKFHPKGEKWDVHYHKRSVEITYLIRGKMMIQGRELTSGDIFTIFPYEVANPVFLEDCEVVIIKTPSVVGDKYNVPTEPGGEA